MKRQECFEKKKQVAAECEAQRTIPLIPRKRLPALGTVLIIFTGGQAGCGQARKSGAPQSPPCFYRRQDSISIRTSCRCSSFGTSTQVCIYLFEVLTASIQPNLDRPITPNTLHFIFIYPDPLLLDSFKRLDGTARGSSPLPTAPVHNSYKTTFWLGSVSPLQ